MRKAFEDDVMSRDLSDLARSYIENKSELDSYEKICDSENAAIKQKMKEQGIDEFTVGDKKIRKIVTKSYNVNEVKLLQVVKELGLDCVRTKEYVDTEALEDILYRLDPVEAAGVAQKLDQCKTPKEVVQLRILKNK